MNSEIINDTRQTRWIGQTTQLKASAPITNCRLKQPMATLDLHGCRKSEAIRRLTDFLEAAAKKGTPRQQSSASCWVSVVTGSGSHSQDGPVLRNAVEALLTKRKMVFSRENKGSFIVDAKSGIVLYNPGPATDTKFKIVPHDESRDLKLVGRQQPVAAAAVVITDQERWRQQQHRYLVEHPLPRQVAQDDRLLERIKDESKQEQHKEAKEKLKLKQAMKRVVSESRLEFERDCLLRKNEEDRMQHALLQSERDVSEDYALFRTVLAESAQDLALRQEEEDRELQEMLAMSVQDMAMQQEEEERELQAALARSMNDAATVMEEEGYNGTIPVQSMSKDEQDDLLILAMEASLRDL